MKHSEHLTAAQIKEYCEAQWNKPGLACADSYISWEINASRNGLNWFKRRYATGLLSKEQKARRNKLAMYNPKLKDAILAKADKSIVEQHIFTLDKYGCRTKLKDGSFKTEKVTLPRYVFTQQPKAEAPTVQEPAIKPARKSIQRVTQRKIDAAAAILAKLDKTQWAAFFARFGVKSDIAEKIAANDNLTEAAREFLKAALAA
jgi:hypothetical protein